MARRVKRTWQGVVKKEDVLQLIQNYIRKIQMNDYGKDEGIPQLYNLMTLVEKMTPLEDYINV